MNLKLLYQASRDGFDNKIFHSKCDGIGRTLTVIKSQNSNIFGGYTSADWSGKGFKYDSTAFLFSLVNKYNVAVKMNVTISKYAIFTDPDYSIMFGGGFDLYCYYKQYCSCFLGHSYQLPSFLTYGSYDANTFLGGIQDFEALEIEVWIDGNIKNKFIIKYLKCNNENY